MNKNIKSAATLVARIGTVTSLITSLVLIAGCSSDQATDASSNEHVSDAVVPMVEKEASPELIQKSNNISWFGGSTDTAFEQAKRLNKPIFLYWGAEWCPPCHEIKSTVFQEASFIKATQQFISVYLDGDTANAQELAEKFGVIGYPTMVVFNAKGEELTRIPNGLDIQAYANVLQLALNNLTPIEALLVKAEDSNNSLNNQECEILTNHSWYQDQEILKDRDPARAFYTAWQACPSEQIEEKAILYMQYLAQVNQEKATATGYPSHLDNKQEENALSQLYQYLNDPSFIHNNIYSFLGNGAKIVNAITEKGSTQRETLLGKLDQALATAGKDQGLSTLVRTQLLRGRVEYALFDDEAQLPTLLESKIQRLVTEALATDKKSPTRHATINGIGNLLNEAGKLNEAKEVLANEAASSKYAYYYMLELAAVEQALGNSNASIEWLKKAYGQAKGPATRFQWGYNYLSGRLEMDADNLAAIVQTFEQLFGELTQSQALHQRSKSRLDTLAEKLVTWASNEKRQNTLKNMSETAKSDCENTASNSIAYESCLNFVQKISS